MNQNGFELEYLPQLLSGAITTLLLVLCAAAIGLVAGLLFGVARTSRVRVLSVVAAVYINIVRGIPLLVLIFFIYFGVPMLFPRVSLSAFWSGVIALALFATAYLAEIFRGSIEAIPRGQREAADALGGGGFFTYWYVLLPQAFKIAVPPGIGFLIALIKDTSLVTVIGVMELTKAGRAISSLSGDPIVTYLVVAAIYFVICYGVSLLGRAYERRLGPRAARPRTLQLTNV